MANDLQGLLGQAVALHQAGRLAEARAVYQKILMAQPGHHDALHLLGVVCFQTGDNSQAVTLIGRAIAGFPGNPAPYQNIALALKALGRNDEALASYGKAIALKPGYADAHNNRGILLQALGRAQEALADYDLAIRSDPEQAEVWNNRGAVLRDMKRLEEALASCERALALDPNLAQAHKNRGAILHDMNRLEEALPSYDRAIALNPADAKAYNNRGVSLRDLRRLEAALADFEKAIALKPEVADSYANRAPALRDLHRLDEAAASTAAALRLNPGGAFLPGYYLHSKMTICDWAGLEESVADGAAQIRAGRQAVTPFTLLGLVDDPALQRAAAEIYCAPTAPRSAALGPFAPRPAREKIRIGYYSADFHGHATSYLMAEMLESHDAGRFELTAFSFGPDDQDAMRRRVAAAFGEFLDVRQRSDREIAALSRQRGIDIAVDLKGYTTESRPGIFAEGCAPLQVHYLGYPGTMGADYIDYLVADHTLIGAADRGFYREKIVRLPHSYQANDSQRKISSEVFTRAQMGLPERGFVFCCFNNNYKILPTTFDAWMRILKAVDGSVLWLLQDDALTADNLRRQAQARGVDAARLVFAGRLPLDAHLARHRLADLFLDTWPYNAHTTASDALWAGLPVLTRMGKSFASRVAASLLNAVGLPELIAGSAEAYEAAAIALAQGPVRLAELRAKLEHGRISAPLFDGKRLARHLEAAYENMFARHAAGLAPEHIDIAP
jgi:predicted O-linked N-acetylglucosamine transferase (SPINDLY family)